MSRNNSYDLSGKTALVTGASRGIGAAIANALGDAGATVVPIAMIRAVSVFFIEMLG